MKILYVEDEPAHVVLTQRTLEGNFEEEFTLLHAETIGEAIKVLDSNPDIDLILTDLRLPDGSGLDLLQLVNQRGTPIGVVLVTGQGDEESAVAALKAGAADYLVKQSDYLLRLPVAINNAVARGRLLREQAALREAEVKYQSLIEQTPAVVFLDDIDDNETTLYISPRVEELTGFTPDEWLADPLIWENHIYPEDRERIAEADHRSHKMGEHFRDEYRFIRSDGRVIWIKEDTNLVRDGKGNALYWQGILLDITKEKESQAIIQQSEERFRRVFHASPIATCVVVLEDGRFIDANQAFLGLIGLPLENLIGKTSLQLGFWKHTQDRETFIDQLKEHGSLQGIEIQYVNVPNGPKDTLAYYEIIELGGRSCVLSMFYEVTEQKKAQKALQRQLIQLTVLHSIALAGTESNSEDEIIERFVQIASQLYNEVCGVLLLIENDEVLKPHPSYFGADVSNWMDGTPITEGVTGESVSLGKTIRLGEITQNPAYIEIAKGTRSELCVPIRVNTRIIGVFNVESKQKDAFDEEDEQFLNTIAGNLGTALERLRLVKEEKRRAKDSYESELARREQAETLQDAIASLSTTLDIHGLYETILDSLTKLVYHDSASIFIEHKSGEMEIVAARGFNSLDEIVGKKLQKSAKWHELALSRKPLIMVDAQTDPRFEKWKGSELIRGWLGMPMIAQDQVIGFINLDSHRANTFGEREATLVQTFANSAAIAIGNVRLYRDALRAAERRAVLHQISQDMVRFSQDSEQIYTSIHGAAGKLMACDVFTISLRNPQKNTNDFVYRVEGDLRYPVESLDAGTGITSRIIETGKSVVLKDNTDIEKSGALRFGAPKHVRSAVTVPLRISENIIGTISAQAYEPFSYGDEEQALLEMLATHAATAIENARLYSETQNRIKEMETINRLSSSLRTTQSQAEMLDIFLDETLALLGEEHGSIWLFDHSSHSLIQRAARGVARNVKVKQLLPNQGIVSQVFQSGMVYTSSDLRNDPLLHKPNVDVILPGFGGACIPIKSTAGTLGAIFIQVAPNRQVTKITDLLFTLAEIVGNSIHRAELFDQSQEQVRRVTALRDIDSAIASSTDLRVTLNILTENTLRQLKVDAVDVVIYRPELQSLNFFCGTGFRTPSPTRPQMRIGEGLAGQVVVKGRIDHVIDLKNSRDAQRDPMLLREGFVTYIGVPLIVKGQIKGVFEIFHRASLSPNAEWMQFLQTLAGQAAIAIDNSQLFDNLQRSNQELTQAYDTTLEGWARALELRDRETEGHTRRVTELTLRLARRLGIREDGLINIYRGVLLHDIGKMGVPDQILKKTGPLSEVEWVEMRRHPQFAYDLLSPITYLHSALDIPYCHHEHWDGSGYPRGLRGEQIPLSARIFSVVDIWDALLSDRPYRKAWPRQQVLDYIHEISGTTLDPKIAEIFIAMMEDSDSEPE